MRDRHSAARLAAGRHVSVALGGTCKMQQTLVDNLGFLSDLDTYTVDVGGRASGDPWVGGKHTHRQSRSAEPFSY